MTGLLVFWGLAAVIAAVGIWAGKGSEDWIKGTIGFIIMGILFALVH